MSDFVDLFCPGLLICTCPNPRPCPTHTSLVVGIPEHAYILGSIHSHRTFRRAGTGGNTVARSPTHVGGIFGWRGGRINDICLRCDGGAMVARWRFVWCVDGSVGCCVGGLLVWLLVGWVGGGGDIHAMWNIAGMGTVLS